MLSQGWRGPLSAQPRVIVNPDNARKIEVSTSRIFGFSEWRKQRTGSSIPVFVASPVLHCERRTNAPARLGGEEFQLVVLGTVAGRRQRLGRGLTAIFWTITGPSVTISPLSRPGAGPGPRGSASDSPRPFLSFLAPIRPRPSHRAGRLTGGPWGDGEQAPVESCGFAEFRLMLGSAERATTCICLK